MLISRLAGIDATGYTTYMTGFMIKMWFFKLWDNLVWVLLLNLGFALLVGLILTIPSLLVATGSVLPLLSTGIGILLVFLYGSAINRYTLVFANGSDFHFADFGKNVKVGIIPALALFVVTILIAVIIPSGMQFYGELNNIMGIFVLAFLFWLLVFWFLMIQYYWPLNAQFEPKIGKLFRKSMLLFFDNPAFTIYMLIGSIIIIILSSITLGLFPGFVGLLLWHQVGLKLRMYKYDYLETQDGAENAKTRNKIVIPWNVLLQKEKEKIGTRTLRDMFFPWKDGNN